MIMMWNWIWFIVGLALILFSSVICNMFCSVFALLFSVFIGESMAFALSEGIQKVGMVLMFLGGWYIFKKMNHEENKDIPDNCVAAGNPCRVLRPINEEDKLTSWNLYEK